MDESFAVPSLEGLGPIFLVAAAKERLPADIFAQLKAQIDRESLNPERVSHDEHLVGHVRNGEQIKSTHVIPPLVALHICVATRKYINTICSLNNFSIENNFQVSFRSSWIVKQKSGDYNPIHHHDGQISGIIYINIPDHIKSSNNMDGKLSFVFGQSRLDNLDLLGDRTIVPCEGDMYLFPAWLHHAVYPFSGDEERISFAFNLRVTGLKPQKNAISGDDAGPV